MARPLDISKEEREARSYANDLVKYPPTEPETGAAYGAMAAGVACVVLVGLGALSPSPSGGAIFIAIAVTGAIPYLLLRGIKRRHQKLYFEELNRLKSRAKGGVEDG